MPISKDMVTVVVPTFDEEEAVGLVLDGGRVHRVFLKHDKNLIFALVSFLVEDA